MSVNHPLNLVNGNLGSSKVDICRVRLVIYLINVKVVLSIGVIVSSHSVSLLPAWQFISKEHLYQVIIVHYSTLSIISLSSLCLTLHIIMPPAGATSNSSGFQVSAEFIAQLPRQLIVPKNHLQLFESVGEGE